MDPPASAFINTNYTECDVFVLPDDHKYAIFYDNNPGSFVIADVQERLDTHDILIFTDVRAINFSTWKTIAGDDFCVVHQPCFKKNNSNCRGYGGITIIYRRDLRVINQGRIFTWKLLNTEEGKIFPGVEGVFIDVENYGKVVRYSTLFHWKHFNSKGFDPRTNVVNFISNFMTKPIAPDDSSLPKEVHIFGRFNFPSDAEFLEMIHKKHSNLSLITVDSPDIFVLSTNPADFQQISNDPHQIFFFALSTK